MAESGADSARWREMLEEDSQDAPSATRPTSQWMMRKTSATAAAATTTTAEMAAPTLRTRRRAADVARAESGPAGGSRKVERNELLREGARATGGGVLTESN